ncbi:ABC transporter ATP-binding protein [Sanguibacter antarcticus]|uniref:Putative ABC transport system ATP-binding protein n=1 Tax=Sanguibacter antarcticus TaxID=372484 RepID=A0A2A9E397_9MICO|nr:ABC transporter ATP-binding protein [Sanguibacter antarcticus]PFG32679.1 putative ABC transport system ATP-binding protein [Sanguibacter antarcticus]
MTADLGPVVLTITDAHRTHGRGAHEVHALRGVSLQVRAGELVAVMGPSGSGKSTLLNIAGGLDTPTSGSVTVSGNNLGGVNNARRAQLRRAHIGYVFQDYNLVPALTARENVSLPLEFDGVRPHLARIDALAALAETGALDITELFPDQLSGGQQQRVAIARALVGPRQLILADEPTGALDSVAGEEIMQVLRARIDGGAAGLMVTHDARYAAWADRTVFLRDGRITDSTGALASAESLLAGAAGQAG